MNVLDETVAYGLSESEFKALVRGERFYVYGLMDATTVFYVGKGQGSRVFQHHKAHMRGEFDNMRKHDEIARCLNDGGLYYALFEAYEHEADAIAHERELIGKFAETLTNIALGGSCQCFPRPTLMEHARRSFENVDLARLLEMANDTNETKYTPHIDGLINDTLMLAQFAGLLPLAPENEWARDQLNKPARRYA